MTRVCLGSVDLEGFTLGARVLKMVFREATVVFGGWSVHECVWLH